MMSLAQRVPLLGPQWFNPYALPNLAAAYDLNNVASLVYDGSNRLTLASDLSGNSAVNGLALNASSGNSASTPTSVAVAITGDIDLRMKVDLLNTRPSSEGTFFGRYSSAPNRSYLFQILQTGILRFIWSANGTAENLKVSTVALASTGFTGWVRVTLDVDNGAAGNDVIFYTSLDGITWTQLGATVTTAGTTSILAGTNDLYLGVNRDGNQHFLGGIVYRAQVYNGIGGTVAFDEDFTLAAKLATTVTEQSSNAATVTINSSGTTGARICGARDLYQATNTNKPIFTLDANGNYATGDGINDFVKSAPYSSVQPRTRFTVFSVPSWSSGKVLWDGNAAGSSKFYQVTGTPQLTLNAGSDGPSLTTFVLGNTAVACEVINGASSSLARNLDAAATGDAGAGNPGGSTLCADGGNTNFSPLVFRERLEYSAVLDAATITRIKQFLIRKWRIAA
jgi:hypothetical protein